MDNRNTIFSDLKAKFIAWLTARGANGMFAAADHYANNLEAIGLPIAPHAAVGAKWEGLYELLTGDRPIGVYQVHSLAEFSQNYGKAVSFFSVETKAKEDVRELYPSCTIFDQLFDFAHSTSKSGNGDGGHTRSAFNKYTAFLCELEAQVMKISSNVALNEPLQKIYYGAPGTGKSHGTEGLIKKYGIPDDRIFRTTFHPDSDYSTFVGAYKPTMGNDKIVYSFRPQAFMNAYVKAWEDISKPVVLVVEEINRGNCAQIFGDLFQLLDREDDGYSKYPIIPDSDLASWIDGKVPDATTLKLPPNLYIWATMNTSDQSLFPIDSAFKRRWDWKYVPIAKPDKEGDDDWRDRAIQADGKYYDWWKFISILNHFIRETTKSEDKQLGYFFVKAPDATGIITADQFVNKVLFYLFGDVFKDWELPTEVFEKDAGTHAKYAFKDFFYDGSEPGHKAGEVKEDEVVKFIKHLKWDGKDVTESADAPKTNGEKASATATAAAGAASSTSAASAGQS